MKTTYSRSIANALLVYVRCPTTGATIDAIKGDDKVICNCAEALEHGGTHLVCLCEPSTVDDYIRERGFIARD